jgi:hypothetical protein
MSLGHPTIWGALTNAAHINGDREINYVMRNIKEIVRALRFECRAERPRLVSTLNNIENEILMYERQSERTANVNTPKS